jgi:membrane associated rhomboid family serine protease
MIHAYLTQAPVAAFFLAITLATSLMGFRDERIVERFILHPFTIVRQRQWYRLFTSTLLHGDMTHLLFNFITCLSFALFVERIVGSVVFALIYLGSALVGSLVPTWLNRNNPSYYALGASGAVSGVIFSCILYRPEAQLLLFFILPIPAWLFAVLFIAFSYLMGRYSKDNIGHEAHLAGAAAGALITIALDPGVVESFLFRLRYL